MQKSIPLYFLFLLLVLACSVKETDKMDLFKNSKKVVLNEDGPEEFLYWEFDDSGSLWGNEMGKLDGLEKYKDSLLLDLGEAKYRLTINKESTQNLEKSLIQDEENGDKINSLLTHTGSVGKIRKINYLESQILNYQIEKYPMFSHPTEFHGFIIKDDRNNKVRVYFGSSDTEWPPHPTLLIKEVEKELKNGWKLIRHLHNHYCKKDDNYLGILAPSLADAQYYKMLKERFQVEKALITNGFHTVEIRSEDFEKFESH